MSFLCGQAPCGPPLHKPQLGPAQARVRVGFHPEEPCTMCVWPTVAATAPELQGFKSNCTPGLQVCPSGTALHNYRCSRRDIVTDPRRRAVRRVTLLHSVITSVIWKEGFDSCTSNREAECGPKAIPSASAAVRVWPSGEYVQRENH